MLAFLTLQSVFAASPQTVISVDAAGAAGFANLNVGRMGIVAEHVRGGRHGVTLQLGTIHLHGDPNHLWSFGGSIGYRYHLNGATNAPFVGARVAVERGFGRYIWDPEHPDSHSADANVHLSLRHTAITPHVGYRWALTSRLQLTYRVGAGLGRSTITAKDPAHPHAAEAEAYGTDRWQLAPVVFDSELSLGVRIGKK